MGETVLAVLTGYMVADVGYILADKPTDVWKGLEIKLQLKVNPLQDLQMIAVRPGYDSHRIGKHSASVSTASKRRLFKKVYILYTSY